MEAEALSTYISGNCSHLGQYLSDIPVEQAGAVTLEITQTCSPKQAAGRIDDLLNGETQEQTKLILDDPQVRQALLTTVPASRFLFSVLRRSPDLLSSFFLDGAFHEAKGRPQFETELTERLTHASAVHDVDRILRQYKDEEYLRIGTRDLTGTAGIEEVMRELSDLAGACIAAALEFHWRRLEAKHGRPPGAGDQTGFAVIGLGKMSGGELNFSSDVDLMFLRIPDGGRTDGAHKVPSAGFYESLARSVMQTLSQVTDDGFVFRVDLRLRPEGEKGELVPSIENALNYYLEWGRTWERAAFMKAAAIAGDLTLARSFLKGLEPFLYRKHLDYSTLEDMREMKLLIEAQLKRKPGINIKLGQGGIREIEFFVQALQLINAGRAPAIRAKGTLESLRRLEDAGLLESDTAQDLRDAYLFFRKTEHRIQINHQLQTHELPRTVSEQEELARRMGYRENALPAFMADLDRRRKLVEDLFSGLFYSSDEEVLNQCSSTARRITDGMHDPNKTIEALGEAGFSNPKASYDILSGLFKPPEDKRQSSKGGRLLSRLSPLLLDELLKVPDPDEALMMLDRYLRALHSRAGYFSTLLENPPTARFLVKILAESRFFAALLIRHPESIDSLIGRWTLQHPQEKDPLHEQLHERLQHCENYEAELDVLRIFKNEELLRIGLSHLLMEINSPTARWLVTELSEVCLDGAVYIAVNEMNRKFGSRVDPDSVPFVILGLGKLGGMEMSYLSDVDVIFVYQSDESEIGRLSAHEWFTRLANRIISVLSVPTAEGVVFEIDTRLRPSGNKGPLVSSLQSFREYHEHTSELWEKQALIKARSVTGPWDLAETVDGIVRDCVLRTRITNEDITEIARIRQRMQTELAKEDSRHVDLKTGHGGLVDIDFFIQAQILLNAHEQPEILTQNSPDALEALFTNGVIDEEAFRVLDSGYRFLTNLEDRLRIMEHKSVDRIEIEGAKLQSLARRLGYGIGNEKQLMDEYFRVTRDIRRIYSSLFGV